MSKTVYFMRGEATGRIKIGHSKNPQGRRKGVSTKAKEIVVILATLPTNGPNEAEVHELFKHLLIANEWFRPEQDLLDYIRDHAIPWVHVVKTTTQIAFEVPPETHRLLRVYAAQNNLSLHNAAEQVITRTLTPVSDEPPKRDWKN